jgi:hypothetical protein
MDEGDEARRKRALERAGWPVRRYALDKSRTTIFRPTRSADARALASV